MKHYFLILFVCFSLVGISKEKPTVQRFDFGSGKAKNGWTPVTPTTVFSEEKGFGLIPSGQIEDGTKTDFLSSKKPFYFVVNLPEGKPEVKSITEVLNRIYTYLDQTTYMSLINKDTQVEVTDYSKVDEKTIFKPGDFRLNSYEWGVTYAGMLLASETTGDPKYASYTKNRLKFLAEIHPWFAKLEQKQPNSRHAFARVLNPHALDDCGAMCAAMIKTQQMPGFDGDLKPMVNTFADYISTKEFRFADRTLARNQPLPNSLWLDDLFMSVPALAQIGKYSGEKKYFDDAVKQVTQFADRMFNYDKGLFMHGWIMGMDEHPQFHWARANGWAVMTMVELLEVLPENHEGRAKVLNLLCKHIRGLANYKRQKAFCIS